MNEADWAVEAAPPAAEAAVEAAPRMLEAAPTAAEAAVEAATRMLEAAHLSIVHPHWVTLQLEVRPFIFLKIEYFIIISFCFSESAVQRTLVNLRIISFEFCL